MVQKYVVNKGANDLDTFLENTFASFSRPPRNFWSRTSTPGYTSRGHIPIDLKVKGDNVFVSAELPGRNTKNISLEIDKNILKIETAVEEQEDEQEHEYFIKERHSGFTKRIIRLPHMINSESAKSTYENGILQITLPKMEKSASRHIPIN